MDVSVIIVNFNTTELTKKCIDSILTFSRHNSFEIILVDNASEDRNIEKISDQYPQIQTIYNKKNLGFGAANNIGIQNARGEFIFLLNSDTFLQSDAIKTFCDFMQNPFNQKVAICGAELLNNEGNPATSFGNFPTLFGAFSSLGFRYLYSNYYLKYLAIGVANYNEEVKKVDFISGADLFIRTSVLKEVGGFDEDFFLYFEETELSFRVKKAGYESVILPFVKIVHLEGGSSNGFNYKSYEYYQLSRKLFYKKCYGNFKATLFLPLDLLFMLLKTVSNKEDGNWFQKLKIIVS